MHSARLGQLLLSNFPQHQHARMEISTPVFKQATAYALRPLQWHLPFLESMSKEWFLCGAAPSSLVGDSSSIRTVGRPLTLGFTSQVSPRGTQQLRRRDPVRQWQGCRPFKALPARQASADSAGQQNQPRIGSDHQAGRPRAHDEGARNDDHRNDSEGPGTGRGASLPGISNHTSQAATVVFTSVISFLCCVSCGSGRAGWFLL